MAVEGAIDVRLKLLDLEMLLSPVLRLLNRSAIGGLAAKHGNINGRQEGRGGGYEGWKELSCCFRAIQRELWEGRSKHSFS